MWNAVAVDVMAAVDGRVGVAVAVDAVRGKVGATAEAAACPAGLMVITATLCSVSRELDMQCGLGAVGPHSETIAPLLCKK